MLIRKRYLYSDFRFRTFYFFYWSFLTDIKAVNGLISYFYLPTEGLIHAYKIM